MTGRYKITFNSCRAWEPEKCTARRWSVFVRTCESLAADGLEYSVSFALTGDDPHILVRAWGTSARRRKPAALPRRALVQPLKAAQCAVHAQEAEWFLPENRERRNSGTAHWQRRGARHAELTAMAETELRAEVEFWRELELLSGQREHFKPGRTEETAWADDEVAA